ncbi:MAG: AI-2E family transporter [Gemmatimonadales bacterium]|nr:MAG: AI-2E family transporter [Gemmatimonadales bacterium]
MVTPEPGGADSAADSAPGPTPDSAAEQRTGREPDNTPTPLVAAALVVLAFLLWSLGDVLNPFLLFLAVAGMLLPWRESRFFRPFVYTAGALTLFWLLSEMGALLAPFVLAVVLAYVLNPAVSWLAGKPPLRRLAGPDGTRRLARTGAVTLLALPVLGGLLALGLWGVPWAAGEVADLTRKAPEALARLGDLLAGTEEFLLGLQLPGVDGAQWVERLRELEADDVVAFLEERRGEISERAWEGVLGVGRGLGAALAVLGYLVLTPVITFYLMRDWDRLVGRIRDLIPADRQDWIHFARDYDEGLGAYLRGQVLVSLSVGTMTAVGLLLVQFPYAIFLGAIVAVFNVVPYLGLVVSLIPALVIALTTGSVGASLLKVAVVYTVAQTIESAVIAPRIVGDSTGLHPVWILLAIATGGFFFGFVGLLIAVPAAVGIKLVAIRAVARA